MEDLEQMVGWGVGSAGVPPSEEAPVLKEQVVEEVLARLRRGESVVGLARAYGVDPKTIRAWRARGAYRARASRTVPSVLDPYADWLRARAPEVEYNAAVLHRELTAQGFRGSPVLVRRFVRPLRLAATPAATVRYETAPGQQAQVDFGQRRVWVGEALVTAHVFVFTLGFSRRLFAYAFAHERLAAVLEGHERAFRHFEGVPEQIVVDNARPVVLQHHRDPATGRHRVVWHPTYEDFAVHYGFRPWAHWPYRPQTKGKIESGVKYVQHNALVGKRFRGFDHVNEWLLEWTTTVADTRVHGTTHEVPRERFQREQLAPLGARPAYARERVQHRVVASDALVAIGGSRYSVPVEYVGRAVVIRELLGSYEILSEGTVIARHRALGRHQVAMERTHYAGLLRPPGAPPAAAPPHYDPGYPASADVAVRDLGVYAAIAEAALADHAGGSAAGDAPGGAA
ncbi:MAG TPA: IS21 family transposase [Gemmatimonadaceae bacterium]